MMPRRCFVKRQRLHSEFRLGLQVESIDVEDAGAGTVRRCALVEGARSGFRPERLYLADLVVRLREHREELRQRRVDPHLEFTVSLHEVAALREVELRIGFKVPEEGGEVAFEANLPAHGVHLVANSRDFVEANLVDFLRRHACRRVPIHKERIPVFAVGQRGPGDCRARFRHVLVTHIVANPPVRRNDLVVDRRPVGGRQPLPLLDRHRIRKPADRREERAVLRLRDDHAVELPEHLLHDRPGLHHALRHALAHVHDRLVHVHDEAVEALEPVLVVRHRDEGLGIRPEPRAGIVSCSPNSCPSGSR